MGKKVSILFFFVLLLGRAFGQTPTKVVIYGDYIVLSGGTSAKPIYMVVNNLNNTAISTPIGGWIISENEFNMVQWNIGTDTGIYVVPFGYSTLKYLPLTLDINTAGVGGGNIKFSTFHTTALNSSAKPSDVTNLSTFISPGSPSDIDNSYNIGDRFYIIDANTGYTTKPASGNIKLSYISGAGGSSEILSPNVLNESHLMAERYNSGSSTWSDWFGLGCTDAIVSGVGTVQTGPVSASNMYRSWALWDNLRNLPVNISVNNILSVGGTGSATVTAYGGVSPYTYSWLPSGGSSSSATGLSAATYTVNVTDAHGCAAVIPFVIENPCQWTDTVGVHLSGDTLIKYTPSGWNNGGAASKSVLLSGQNGWIEDEITRVTDTIAFGLTSINVSSNYTTYDFAFLIQGDSISIYQRGVLIQNAGTVDFGDTLKIQRVDTSIEYIKNGNIIHTSNSAGANSIVAASYVGSLEAVASFSNIGCHISGITWDFFQSIFVAGSVNPQFGPDSLGSSVLTAVGGKTPYQYIYNLVRYPFRNEFRPYLDSIMHRDSIALDTSGIYHQFDSLRQNNQSHYTSSGINAIAVVDSNFDTTSINNIVGENVTWINSSGLTISKIESPRIVGSFPYDSISTLIGALPNLTQPVTCYSDSATYFYKSSPINGWSSGEATSINSLPYTCYGKVSFVIPTIISLEAVGLKLDSISDIPGYGDLLYGFYFQSGALSLIINGSLVSMGTYRAGDMFSIENAYDTVRFIQRIIFKQENQIIKIVYISRYLGRGSLGIRYAFKAAISSLSSTIIGIHIIGPWWFGPKVIPTITPASCGFPNSGAISLSISSLPYGWTVSGYLWSPGNATTASISNLTPGRYSVRITISNGSSSISNNYGVYNVGYKIYWANLKNALTLGPTNTNSIYEVPPSSSVGVSGGNSSNSVNYSPGVGNSWVQFSVGNANDPPLLYSYAEFGYSNNPISYNNSNIACGLRCYRYPYTFTISYYIFSFHFYFTFTINYLWTTGVGNISGFSLLTTGPENTYQILNNNLITPIASVYLNNNFEWTHGVINASSNYIVKATLQGGTAGQAMLDTGLCSFGCPDMNFQYSTLTKTLDGSYYLTPYGNLSFKYDEEYVNNGQGLPYTIYDMGHNIMYSSTLPPTAYKDNYYTIDLTAINPLIYNGWFILQVTNKKGEVTELRFKN